MLAEWINGETWRDYQGNRTHDEVRHVKNQLKSWFVLDCLFGNWDVIGANEDNILVDKNSK